MTARRSYPRRVPHGLMFHRFHASPVAGAWQGALTPEEFEQVLLYVGIDRILPAGEWLARLEEDRLGADDLCLTFDDGLRSQLEYALPVLERHSLRAFWFVYSCVFDGRPVKSEVYSYVAGQIGGMATMIGEFLRRCPADLLAQLHSPAYAEYSARICAVAPFYSDADIRYRFLRNNPANQASVEDVMDGILAAHGFSEERVALTLWLRERDLVVLTRSGHHVGLHSYSHPYAIGELSAEAQRDQYGRNLKHIAAVTGRTPDSMSHPLSSYNHDSLTVLAELGIRCGFCANMASAPGEGMSPGRLTLPREDSATLLSMLQRATVHDDNSRRSCVE